MEYEKQLIGNRIKHLHNDVELVDKQVEYADENIKFLMIDAFDLLLHKLHNITYL